MQRGGTSARKVSRDLMSVMKHRETRSHATSEGCRMALGPGQTGGKFVPTGPAVSGRLRLQATASPKPTRAAGADNASGTHRPGHYIRSFCAARDRLRAEDDLAVAGWPARAVKPGGRRSAPPRGARDRTARIVGRECVALCAAQAAAAAELRGAGLSP